MYGYEGRARVTTKSCRQAKSNQLLYTKAGSFLPLQIIHYFCFAVLCPDPADLVNGMVTFSGNSVGDTATYTCNSGFELVGNANVTCMQVDENSAAYPTVLSLCRREYCMDIARTIRSDYIPSQL